MNDFSEVKVGDQLYSLRHGYVPVEVILTTNHPYNLIMKVHGCVSEAYTMDGKRNTDDDFPDLYWDKPEIIAPEKPKKKVKAYLYVLNHGIISSYFYTNKCRYNYHGQHRDYNVGGTLDNCKRTDFYIEVE